MNGFWHQAGDAVYLAAAMGWEILWPLILGFTFSGIVQAVVSKREASKLLPDSSPQFTQLEVRRARGLPRLMDPARAAASTFT